MSKVTVGVGFKTDTSGLMQAKKSLQEIANLSARTYSGETDFDKVRGSLTQIRSTASTVEKALTKAFNPKLNSLSIQTFNKELKSSNLTLNSIYKDFSKLGSQGEKAFRDLTSQVLTTNRQLKETGHFIDSLGETLMNTVKWQIATNAVNTITGSVSRAYGYVKSLDSSLNDIRIVTGKSADEMDAFAESANKAAKNLKKQTTDYTNASLIYYQQGLTDEEVQARTEVTLKAANVTQQSAAAVSEELTAVWNGYKVAAEDAELYVDKLAKVAANTASDLQELSVGMSKVASSASSMGVDIDQLAGQMSTIISVTRQAPESVGTALKTIYARLGDLKVEGGEDEWGTTFGDVSGQLKEVGIDVTTATGDLRDMGEVIEEVGEKWQTWTGAQKQAIAIVMAGKRQYNNLFALFDNWNKYTEAVNLSTNAVGTLQKQQDIYAQSTKAKLAELSAATEGVYDSLLDATSINNVVEGLTAVVSLMETFIDSIGGGQTVLMGLGSLAMQIFSKQFGESIARSITNFQNLKYNLQEANAELLIMREFKGLNVNDEGTKALIAMKSQVLDLKSVISIEQEQEINNIIRERNELEQNKNAWLQTSQAANEFLNSVRGVSNIDIAKSSISDLERFSNNITGVSNQLRTLQRDTTRAANFLNEFNNRTAEGVDDQELYINTLERTFGILNAMENGSRSGNLRLPFDTTQITEFRQQLEELNTVDLSLDDQVRNLQSILEDVIVTIENTQSHARSAASAVKQESKGASESINRDIETNKQAFNSLINNIKGVKIANDISKTIGQIGQLATAINSVTMIPDIWANQDLSAGQKVLRTVMSLSMVLPTLINGFKALATVKAIRQLNTDFEIAKNTAIAFKTVVNATSALQGTANAADAADTITRIALSKNYLSQKNLEKKSIIDIIALLEKEYTVNQLQLNQAKSSNVIDLQKVDILEKQNQKLTNQIILFKALEQAKQGNNIKDGFTIGEGVLSGMQVNTTEMIGQLTQAEKAAEGAAAGAGSGIAGLLGGMSAGAIAGIAVALAAVAAGITALYIAYKKQLLQAENRVKIAEKEVETSKKLLDSYKEEKNNINELSNAYDNLQDKYISGQSTLEELRAETYKLCKQYGQQDLALKTLSASYSDLNKLMKEAQENASLKVANQATSVQNNLIDQMEAEAALQSAKLTGTDFKRIINIFANNWGETIGDHGLQFAAGKLVNQNKRDFTTELGLAAGLDSNAITKAVNTGYIDFDIQSLAENWEQVQQVMRDWAGSLGGSNIYSNLSKYFETIESLIEEYDKATAEKLDNLAINAVTKFSKQDLSSYESFDKKLSEVIDSLGLSNKERKNIRQLIVSKVTDDIEYADLALQESYYDAIKNAKRTKIISKEENLIKILSEANLDVDEANGFIKSRANNDITKINAAKASLSDPEYFIQQNSLSASTRSYGFDIALDYIEQYEPALHEALKTASELDYALESVNLDFDKWDLSLIDEKYREWAELHVDIIVDSGYEGIKEWLYGAKNIIEDGFKEILDTALNAENSQYLQDILNDYINNGEVVLSDNKITEIFNKFADENKKININDKIYSEKDFVEADTDEKLKIISDLWKEIAVSEQDASKALDEIEKKIIEINSQNDKKALEIIFGSYESQLDISENTPWFKDTESLTELLTTPYKELSEEEQAAYDKLSAIVGTNFDEMLNYAKHYKEELNKLNLYEETQSALSDNKGQYNIQTDFEVAIKQTEEYRDKIYELKEGIGDAASVINKLNKKGGYGSLTKSEKETYDKYKEYFEETKDGIVFDINKAADALYNYQEKMKDAAIASKEYAEQEWRAAKSRVASLAHELSISPQNVEIQQELTDATKKLTEAEEKHNEQVVLTNYLFGNIQTREEFFNEITDLFNSTTSGSSKSKKTVIDDYKNQADAFHDIDIELKNLNADLKELQDIEDNLSGNSLVNNLNSQIEATNKLAEAEERRLKIAEQEKEKAKQKLVSFGATFGEFDNISNYDQLMEEVDSSEKVATEKVQSLQKQINAGIDSGIDISDLEKQLENAEESLKEIQKRNEKIADAIEEYENLNDEIISQEEKRRDYEKEILELKEKQLQAQVKINDYVLDQNNILLDNISDSKSEVKSDINKTDDGEELSNYVDNIVASSKEELDLYEKQIALLEEKKKKLIEIYAVEHNLVIDENGYASLDNEETRQFAETYNKMWDEANDQIRQCKKNIKEVQDELDATDLLKKVDETEAINHEIKKIQRELKVVQTIAKHLEGTALINNLKQQQSIIDKEIKQQRVKLEIQQRQLKTSIEELKVFMLKKEYITDLATDEYGYVTNTYSILTEAAEKSEQEFTIMQGLLNTLNSAANSLMDTMYSIEDLEFDKIELDYDIQDEIKDQLEKKMKEALEDFNAEVDFKLDISDATRRFSKLIKVFKQGLKEADLFGNAKQNLEDMISYLDRDIPLLSTHVNDIMNELAIVQSGGTSQYYGRDEQAILDDLTSYRDKLMDSLDSVDDLIKDIEDSYLDAIDRVKEGFDKIQNSYNQISDIISHNMNLIKLLDGENAYGELANYYTKQAALYEQQLGKTRKELDFWKQKMDEAVAGSDEWKKFEENYTNALSNLNSLVEAGVENLIDKYKNGLDDLFAKYENELTGGSNLANTKEEWDLINESADRYYDTVNGTYEIEKLRNKFLDAANDTNNLSIQEKINAVMDKEIAKLREKDKLTKYDVERANAIYDLTLKQIALEEAQKNKTQMRLRRDSQGNYTYQYVSDEDEISQKRQELLDAQNALYNIDKQGYENNLNDLLELQQNYTEKLKEIYADVTLSDEEREEKIKLLKQTYGEDINNLVAQNEEIRQNLQQSTFDSLSTLYEEDKEKLQQFLDDEGNLLMSELIPQWDTTIQHIADTYDNLGMTMNDVLMEASELVNEYEADLEFLQDAAGVSFDSIREGIDFTINDMEDLISIHDTLLDGYQDEMDSIEDLINELDALRDAYSAVLDEALAVIDAALQVQRLGIKDTESNKNTISTSKNSSSTKTPNSSNNASKPNKNNSDLTAVNFVGSGGSEFLVDPVSAKCYVKPGGMLNPLRLLDSAKFLKYVADNEEAQDVFTDAGISPTSVQPVSQEEWDKLISKWSKGNLLYEEFSSGGYTGEWGDSSGKLGILHQKELILNKDDTEKILKAVDIVRNMEDIINNLYKNNLLNNIIDGMDTSFTPESKALNQNVHIEASFPNVQNSNEIENAFNNLINTASQYAYKRTL